MIRKLFTRLKLSYELWKAERAYKNRHKAYDRTVSAEELLTLSQESDFLQNLKYWYDCKIRTSLDYNIFFDGNTPYTIIERIRYNLSDEISRTRRMFIDEEDFYGTFRKQTLAEFLLPRGMVILKNMNNYVRYPESALLVAIKEQLPQKLFGNYAA